MPEGGYTQDEVFSALEEMSLYFIGCWKNAPDGSAAKKTFYRYITVLDGARKELQRLKLYGGTFEVDGTETYGSVYTGICEALRSNGVLWFDQQNNGVYPYTVINWGLKAVKLDA